MDFLNKMSVSTGLLNYDQLMAQEASTGSNDTPDDTEEKKDAPDTGAAPVSGITKFDLDSLEDTSTEDNTGDTGDTGKQTSKSTDSSTKKYTAIIKVLADELGYDFAEDEFEDNTENFVSVIKDMVLDSGYQVYEQEKETFLTPLQKRFVSMVEQGVDQDEALGFFKEYKKIESVTEDALEDVDTAKEVYKAYLKKTTTFSDKKIEKEIEEEETLGSLTEKAKEAYPELKEIFQKEEKEKVAKAKEMEDHKMRSIQESAKQLQEFLETTEEIAGIKLTQKMKNDWKKEYQTVTTPDGKVLNPISATREMNPTKFDALMRLYNAIGLFKYDKRVNDFRPDLDVLKKLNRKEIYKQIEDAVDSEKNKRIATSGKSIEEMDFSSEKEQNIKKLIEYAQKSKL